MLFRSAVVPFTLGGKSVTVLHVRAAIRRQRHHQCRGFGAGRLILPNGKIQSAESFLFKIRAFFAAAHKHQFTAAFRQTRYTVFQIPQILLRADILIIKCFEKRFLQIASVLLYAQNHRFTRILPQKSLDSYVITRISLSDFSANIALRFSELSFSAFQIGRASCRERV